MAVGEWLTSWQRDYIGSVKRGTTVNYELHLLLYISPLIGLGYCLCLWLHYEASTCCLYWKQSNRFDRAILSRP